MKLREALDNQKSKNRTVGGKVYQIMNSLDSEDKDSLYEALTLRSPDGSYLFGATAVCNALKELGISISSKTISAWRREHCE